MNYFGEICVSISENCAFVGVNPPPEILNFIGGGGFVKSMRGIPPSPHSPPTFSVHPFLKHFILLPKTADYQPGAIWPAMGGPSRIVVVVVMIVIVEVVKMVVIVVVVMMVVIVVVSYNTKNLSV